MGSPGEAPSPPKLSFREPIDQNRDKGQVILQQRPMGIDEIHIKAIRVKWS